jgi:hypothetical protein
MDDVFNDDPAEQQGAVKGEPTTEQQQPAQEVQQPPAQGEQQPVEGAVPPAAGTERHVPLEALEAERKGRQDWKEKAIRAEAERDQLRQQFERSQQPAQQQPQDPLLVMQQQIVNERFNTSEMLVREKFADVDETIATFRQAADKNPALTAQMFASTHPWKFAYDEGKRLKFASEIGNDPAAYRERVKAEVLAELQKAAPASLQSQQPAAPALPQSLAGARSAGGRDHTFTGPTPMEDIFNR